uniref:transposase n=1 Tax=Corynebacterium belfantii TaxID=2014537 RepID=UPI0035E43BAA
LELPSSEDLGVYPDSATPCPGITDPHPQLRRARKPGQASNLVTILVDLAPLVDGHGPARLLDMRPGRSADVLSGWLKERDPSFREQIQVVTMDGFTGYTVKCPGFCS